jgi:hypothetical protein
MLQTKTATLTEITYSLLALQAVNTVGPGGLIVSDSYGLMLSGSASWKCKDAPVPGDWMTVAFNDSSWFNPVVLSINGQGPWGYIPPLPSISLQAKWIWTSNTIGSIYCRLRLS